MHDHEAYHKALDRASWFERPLNFQDLDRLKKKIKDAEDVLLNNPTQAQRDQAIKDIEDAEHDITDKANNFRGGHLNAAARTPLQNLSDWLGGDGPPSNTERPDPPLAPIPHQEDPYDPGHIKLSRIFNWLLSLTTKHLRKINEELAKVKQGQSDADLIAARAAYWQFRNDLDGFRKAIANFDVRETTTPEGFIVSATVVVKYLNPKHSSSTVRIG